MVKGAAQKGRIGLGGGKTRRRTTHERAKISGKCKDGPENRGGEGQSENRGDTLGWEFTNKPK